MPLLLQLGPDELEAVADRRSPRELGRLLQTCRAMAAAAPRHPDWVWLRYQVKVTGWEMAYYRATVFGHLEALRWTRAQGCELTNRKQRAEGHLEMLRWLRALTTPCA